MKLKPPQHLSKEAKLWFKRVCEDYDLGDHHVKLLTLACQAWDRGEAARESLYENGMSYDDRFGQPRARPEVAIVRDASIAFARLVRELGLDVECAESPRSPIVRGRRAM